MRFEKSCRKFLNIIQNYKVAIVGSRSLKDYEFFCQHLYDIFKLLGMPQLIVSGGAEGADFFAEIFAEENGIELLIIKANWTAYGYAAGPLRNSEILDISDIVIAFWNYQSPGTADSIKKAVSRKMSVYIVNTITGQIERR